MVNEKPTVSDYGYELTEYCPHCWTKMDGEMNVGNDSQMVCSADIVLYRYRLAKNKMGRGRLYKPCRNDNDRS